MARENGRLWGKVKVTPAWWQDWYNPVIMAVVVLVVMMLLEIDTRGRHDGEE